MTEGKEIQKKRLGTLLEGVNKRIKHGISNWMTDSLPASPLDSSLQQRKKSLQVASTRVVPATGRDCWAAEDGFRRASCPPPLPRAASKNDN